MAGNLRPRAKGSVGKSLNGLLVNGVQSLATAAGERAATTVTDKVGSMTERLTEYAANSGDPRKVAASAGATKLAEGGSPISAGLKAATSGVKEKVKQLFGRGKKGKKGKGKIKVTNIIESVDVGVPVRVAYNQWTQFEHLPGFMKKVENVNRESDEKLTWRAQVFWSHRNWESKIVEQVPDERIVWRSTGQKGSVDGSISFHAVTPNLTRVLLVLEYHPQGLFEHTGNLWRAQGRRVRLELKHFARHVMTQTILNPDEIEGWRGEIRDGEVVRDHESALAEEQERSEGEDHEPQDRSEGDDREPQDQSEGEDHEPEQDEPEEPEEPEAEEARRPRRSPSRATRPDAESAGKRPARPRRTRQTSRSDA
jgi:uncharacterized membrane protein